MPSIDSAAQLRRLERQPARLIFDTAVNPLPAGVRRRDVTSRHLLYEAGSISLDLRLESVPDTSKAVLVGQLLDHAEPPSTPVGSPVYLVSGDQILQRTASNRHGEFLLNVELGEEPLQLFLPTTTGRMIATTVAGGVHGGR